MKRKLLKTTLLTGGLFLASCEKNSESSQTSDAGSDGVLESFFLSERPDDAVQVGELFENPEVGRPVVVTGEVMGQKYPFVENRSMLVLGDPTKLISCNRIPGDECETPWDVCCEDTDVIQKSIATIQLVDADGRPLKKELKGVHGIKELSPLTVTGVIAEGSNESNLVINATGIHVDAVTASN